MDRLERLRLFFRATARSAIDREIVPKQAMFMVDMLRNVRAVYREADARTRASLLEDARSISVEEGEELARSVVESLRNGMPEPMEQEARGALAQAVAAFHQVALEVDSAATVTLLDAVIDEATLHGEHPAEAEKPRHSPAARHDRTLDVTVSAAVLDTTIDYEPPEVPEEETFAELVRVLYERGYTLGHVLGEGASGRVYFATHTSAGTGNVESCAVKIGRLPQHRRHLQRETAALQEIEHPNLVRYLDDGVVADTFWIAMEFGGASVADVLQKHGGPLPWSATVRILQQVLEGLEALHDHGMLHRDLKPRNILMDETQHVRLVDFGLTKKAHDRDDDGAHPEVSASVGLVGTPRYMSPEQIHEQPLTPASDVWSFGVTAYELFTGTPLFSATNPMALGHQIAQQPIEIESEATPPPVREFLQVCLERDVERRFADATAARLEFEKVAETFLRASELRETLAERATTASGAELVEVATRIAQHEERENPAQQACNASQEPGSPTYDVILERPGQERENMIKLVSKLADTEPAQAAEWLDTTPVTLLRGCKGKEAMKAQKKLAAAGAVATIQKHTKL